MGILLGMVIYNQLAGKWLIKLAERVVGFLKRGLTELKKKLKIIIPIKYRDFQVQWYNLTITSFGLMFINDCYGQKKEKVYFYTDVTDDRHDTGYVDITKDSNGKLHYNFP